MKLGLSCVLFALAATAFGDSIVVNGDFGTGDFTGWTSQGWYVIPGATNFADTGCVGSACISPGGAYVSQVLATNPGDQYTLSFDYNPDVNDDPADGFAELLVQFDGSNAIDIVTGAAPGEGQIASLDGFNIYTVTGLTASTASTTLTFYGRQDPSGDGLTLVSVTDSSVAPEPGSYLMAALGFLALGAAKLRARA